MSEGVDVGRESREIVKELASKYIQARPRKISLKLYWDNKRSSISFNTDTLNQTVEHPKPTGFTSFAHSVLEAYREAYGELEVVPISFREEIYRNDKVSLNLYLTGSAGIFDIFIEYRDKRK